ncbi:MAG: polyketide cyclase [Cellvibrionaceae bacterium]|nr:polyketide cyclase [Cellvibrionaceae bacterium]|tara:strand:- start:80714 stop:81076 length:363 start_codon:yes stop_codon:yes gene_type:complete
MSEYPQAFDHMLAAWNEPDKSRVRGHLEQALHPDVRFVDPSIDVSGIDGFEANVYDVQEKIPGAVYSRTSGVDSQHNFYRYHWAIHLNDELLVNGFDVVETAEDGRVLCVIGFFGDVPEK